MRLHRSVSPSLRHAFLRRCTPACVILSPLLSFMTGSLVCDGSKAGGRGGTGSHRGRDRGEGDGDLPRHGARYAPHGAARGQKPFVDCLAFFIALDGGLIFWSVQLFFYLATRWRCRRASLHCRTCQELVGHSPFEKQDSRAHSNVLRLSGLLPTPVPWNGCRPTQVMLGPDWPLGVSKVLQWLEATDFGLSRTP